jgi:2-polyprenyl-6-hydroxyphenyl methylase/3-demethylubiquinone-9 3-methyltransferase
VSTHSHEIATGERFEFGGNWRRFLTLLNDERIRTAESSLTAMLGETERGLMGQDFLDIGSGSGLFSLAARRLGARVHSLDFDPQSVACTRGLRQRYFPDDPDWVVEEASVLDDMHMQALGTFDIVYSWGVLHHTGEMWHACANAADRVGPGGQLYIAIYNDQGRRSSTWLAVKKAYNRMPLMRPLILALSTLRLRGPSIVRDTLEGDPLKSWKEYSRASRRGMSAWRDIVDWVGGLPFEVAKPEQMLDFYRARGFSLERMFTCAGGQGCNEFVFRRTA